MFRTAVRLRTTLGVSLLLITITSVAMAGTPAPVSVTPNQGSGTSQSFTFEFSDSSGWASLKQVNINISSTGGNANSCLLSYVPSNQFLYLLNDAGNAYLPGARVGSSATFGNSQCSINVQQAGSAGGGNTLTVYATITFTAAYFGNKQIYMGAVDNSGANSGWSILGTWTVGQSGGGGGGSCTPGVAPSVTICSPTNGSTVSSPVHVVAVPSSNNGVAAMAVYFDNTLVYKANVQQVDTMVNAAAGSHYVVVQFWDNSGNVPAKASVNVTVGNVSGQPTATLSASPMTISSGGSSTLSWSTTNATSVSIDNGIGSVPASGSMSVSPAQTATYTLTATGSGGSTTAQATVTVSSTGGSCNPPSSPGAIVCTPAPGSTVSSPVQFTGAGTAVTGTVNHLELWIDNTKIGNYFSNTMSASVPLATGSHTATLVEVDSGGGYIKSAPDTFTVGTSSGGSVSVTISPTSATVATGGVQQFTASVTGSSDTSVTWSVDGTAGGNSTVGTVSSSGLYTAPSATGNHTVTATSVADSTQSASAAVTVITPGTCGGGANNTVSICAPPNGASVTSPFQVTADANSSAPVSKFLVYIDSVLVYQQANTSSINTSVSASVGTHNLVVQYYNGAWIKAAETITVTSSGGGTGTADVLTMHNNPARTGENTNESMLTPANVNPSTFHKIVGYGVDGQVYAQPLLVSDFSIGGGTHNVLYVATEHDDVYAFDADDATGTPYWSESLLAPGQSPASSSDYSGIAPEIGITGTPVIDRGNNTLYVVTMAYVSGAGNEFFLHALDLATGHENFGGPVRINPTVSGSGYGNVGGKLSIEPGCYERVGLALANGIVYATFGHCSHGWVVGYNENTLQLAGVFNSSPNGKGASIWMSGGAPPIDSSGNLYFETGVDADSTTSSGYSDAFIKLSPGLSLLDYFQVSNNAYLTANDADLGSGAPVILPDNSSAFPHEIVGAGKDGRIFLVNRDNMGGFDPNANHVIQVVQSGVQQFDNFFDQPAYWNGELYYHAEGDVLRQFTWTNGKLSPSPVHTGTITFGIHGATPSVSSNGTADGIVWELQVDGQPNNPAILHAYDASDVSHELYNSNMNSADHAGPAVKFTVPTIANGKVYVPAGNEVDIYGLK